MNIDEKYMAIALGLAKRAQGLTNPNPVVGAVIVKGSKIVGRGYHKRRGLPHAEVNALKQAGKAAKGGTLYVTLEPCSHFGRTPPCTGAIIKAGIKKVVAAMKDPNPVTDGGGLKKLNRSGIRTKVGVLEERARDINKPFIKFITSRMPYVTVKIAESLDGKIATRTRESKWITGDDSRSYVKKLRLMVDAVMVGANTIIEDDPTLLGVGSAARQPARIIVDSGLRVPRKSKIFSTNDISQVYVATTKKCPPGPDIIRVRSDNGRVDLKALLKKLGKMGIMHVLVEGGGELVGSLVDERLVDEFFFFIAPKIIGGRDAVASVAGIGAARMNDALVFNKMRIRKFKNDILIRAEVE